MQANEFEQEGRPDPLRRRLARGGLAGTVVLGSMISRPVLGSVAPAYICTMSGKLSGNTSSHGTPVNCAMGRSPGYYKNNPWPALTKGDLPATGSCTVAASGVTGTAFNGFSAGGSTFPVAFKCKNGTVLDPSNWGTATINATMLQVLNTGGGLNNTSIYALGRATVASILNSYVTYPSGSYPLTAKQIIDMFNAVYTGGLYTLPNGAGSWNRDQVLAYFQTLYA